MSGLIRNNPFEAALSGLVKQLPGAESRTDASWGNVLTGLGTIGDKATSTSPMTFDGLSDVALSAMFHGDATARKAVTKRARTALSKGINVLVPETAGGAAAGAKVKDELDRLCCVERVLEAARWENLFGGSVIYVGIDDGQRGADSQAQPIRLDALQRVLWLKTIDRRHIVRSPYSGDIDMDPTSQTYGEPSHYQVSVPMAGSYVTTRIHRSRLIIFGGAAATSEVRESRGGWGISVLDPMYDALQRSVNAWQSSGNAVANAQYTVFSLKGLSAMLGRENGEALMKARSKAMEMAKSLINAILIDGEDKYTRERIDFGNLPDMLDRFMYDVACAADMPVTVLFGRSAAGQNATGEGDRESWEASVEEYREHHLRGRIEELVRLIMVSKQGPTKGRELSGWRATFPPLEVLSALELADRYMKMATADVAYIDAQVLSADEVATSRFTAGGYSVETVIDLAARRELNDAEADAVATGLDDKRLDDRRDGRGSAPVGAFGDGVEWRYGA
jgi:phage-related protein (TIGR01555 family)